MYRLPVLASRAPDSEDGADNGDNNDAADADATDELDAADDALDDGPPMAGEPKPRPYLPAAL